VGQEISFEQVLQQAYGIWRVKASLEEEATIAVLEKETTALHVAELSSFWLPLEKG